MAPRCRGGFKTRPYDAHKRCNTFNAPSSKFQFADNPGLFNRKRYQKCVGRTLLFCGRGGRFFLAFFQSIPQAVHQFLKAQVLAGAQGSLGHEALEYPGQVGVGR